MTSANVIAVFVDCSPPSPEGFFIPYRNMELHIKKANRSKVYAKAYKVILLEVILM